MTDHIKAAKAAGGTTYTNRYYPGETACAFGPEALERFYTLAYRAGMEMAADLCSHLVLSHPGNAAATAMQIEQAIRAHAQNQPKNEHDGSVVSKN